MLTVWQLSGAEQGPEPGALLYHVAMSQELEDLPYEELKARALQLAHDRHDFGFLLELMNHTPAVMATASEGGSLGEFTGSIAETVEAAEEAFGEESVGEFQPLFVARFATYIREHS